MPSIVPLDPHGMHYSSNPQQEDKPSGIIKFTNCRLVKGNELVFEDLWISSTSGKILNGQQLLYEERVAPENIINLQGRILSPGLIDVQLNGAFDFDFSVIPEDGVVAYGKGVSRVNRKLIATGVTSYLPTLTSQQPDVYHKALPFLGPSGSSRDPTLGSESLGAHCEGPFLNPTKNGIHNVAVLQSPTNGLRDLISCYGITNLFPHRPSDPPEPESTFNRPNITLITLAPELPGALAAIAALKTHNIHTSIGHTTATYEEAAQALSAGATMLTHLFNAMPPLHHRNPGPFGLLGTNTPLRSSATSHEMSIHKPFFGLIADGIHLHPTSIAIAFHAHPDGLILVTDAMRFAGMPDGTYDWTNGSRVIKKGSMLTLEENGRIAGSSIQLVDCVSNFAHWTGCGIARALRAVTETPARMLGWQDRKGVLKEGADADLVVFGTEALEAVDGLEGPERLVVEQVWKFGRKLFDREVVEGGC